MGPNRQGGMASSSLDSLYLCAGPLAAFILPGLHREGLFLSQPVSPPGEEDAPGMAAMAGGFPQLQEPLQRPLPNTQNPETVVTGRSLIGAVCSWYRLSGFPSIGSYSA